MNIIVFVTAKDFKEAEKISQALVEQKLIACANIIQGVRSFFWWEGKVDAADEVLLILKTKRSLFKKVEKAVKSLHSYSVPEIIAIPIVAGSKEYLKWVNDSVASKKAG
ncbi:MAG TPA: divalent-cation tolerance protein CutA [Candidatus Omnitrophota bacterium]|nr:divalent-cation tolerance protein CutA [Candidatus Omnitrophota bacterium]HPD84325.1 divalent-cation tolerance protein CutA [Candidatus Omnitrophota bacterium]HRZ03183.1 divalent-cation tolerance protein CutA [Candidatus Omnitrophota bacterium]